MKHQIKSLARELGFDQVGVTQVQSLAEGERAIEAWVREGRHGSMKYLENFAERKKKFYEDFPDAKSVFVLGVNYYTGEKSECRNLNAKENPNDSKIKNVSSLDPSDLGIVSSFGFRHSGLTGKVARYAWGKDYHQVIGKRHEELIQKIKKMAGPDFKAKSCVDIQPVPERSAAQQAGLGFLGKHTGLLSQKFGPWLFLSEIVTNLELEADSPDEGDCGTCTDCQKICPTGALDKDYTIDARLCIAYLTIEHKGIIPRELRPKIKNWVFGCDECFAVCPFTSKSKESKWPELGPGAGVGETLNLAELFEIESNAQHEKKFAGTALLRASRKQMLRNACLVLGNSGKKEAVPLLLKGLQDSAPLVRLHAAWGLSRFQTEEARSGLKARKQIEKDPEVQTEIEWALS